METLSIKTDLNELVRVSAWVAELAVRLALPQSTAFALDLCFEEAVSNVIRHGYGGEKTAPIDLSVAKQSDALHVTIKDRGAAFDPSAAAAPEVPASLEEAKIGGLGIDLIRKFTKSMHYARQDNANLLTLEFALD